jgi:hypothetical protein
MKTKTMQNEKRITGKHHPRGFRRLAGWFAAVSLMACGVGAGLSSPQEKALPPPADPGGLALLEQVMPVAFRVHAAPDRDGDPLDVELIVRTDAANRMVDRRWRAVYHDTILVECADFHDLYYRCEAPVGLRVRVVTENQAGEVVAGPWQWIDHDADSGSR